MEKDKMLAEEAISSRIFDKRLATIIALCMFIVGVLGAFYSVSARVSVLEAQVDNVKTSQDQALRAIEQYATLAQSIDSRLSKLEGALGVTTNKPNR